MKNLVELVGGYSGEGGGSVDQLFVDKFDGGADGRGGGAFARTGLEQV